MTKQKAELILLSAITEMSQWLRPYGYTLSLERENLNPDTLGEYEAGSVFGKDIVIRISLSNIIKCSKENQLNRSELSDEIRLTVYHEVGHALMEQLLDYAEYYDPISSLLDTSFGDTYFDIFNDDRCTEEQIVEAFANGILTHEESLLERCFKETSEQIREPSFPTLFL